MNRKILSLSASALAIGVLSFAPLGANAADTPNGTIAVTETVPNFVNVTATTAAVLPNYDLTTGSTTTFTVTVDTNDAAGYTSAFVGLHDDAGAFNLAGPGAAAQTYTIEDAAANFYAPGVAGPALIEATGSTDTYTVVVAAGQNTAEGAYGDTLTYTAAPV